MDIIHILKKIKLAILLKKCSEIVVWTTFLILKIIDNLLLSDHPKCQLNALIASSSCRCTATACQC